MFCHGLHSRHFYKKTGSQKYNWYDDTPMHFVIWCFFAKTG